MNDDREEIVEELNEVAKQYDALLEAATELVTCWYDDDVEVSGETFDTIMDDLRTAIKKAKGG